MKIKKEFSLTFLFYDYETFGKNPALDKPSQFSYLRVDKNFNIIDSIKSFFCSIPFDYLPDPESILVTGISPQYTKLYGLNEFEFARKIYREFIKKNTCIIGYNNIYFDDEFTRNIFYRNFLNSYEWSWKNGNSRWDILDLLRACYVLRPEGINWPINKNNVLSLKLSDISFSNNIIHNKNHDASSDVYATFQIAKLLKNKKSMLFDFFFKYRTKHSLLTLINFKKFKPIIYISRFFGMNRNYVSCIVPIFLHPLNSNILVSIDLLQDIKNLLMFFKKNLLLNCDYRTLFSIGVRFIYINRCPILVPMNVLRTIDRIRLNINCNLCYSNLYLLNKNIFIKHVLKKFLSAKVFINKSVNKHIDSKIYSSFFSNFDNELIKRIHVNFPTQQNLNCRRYDSRIDELFKFCLARNYPYLLSYSEKKNWIRHYLEIMNSAKIKCYINLILDLLEKYKNNSYNVNLLKYLLKYVKDINKKFLNSVFK
ncbi:MAG: exodeoxyribonuclease I [Buchnera aphidicola (Chaetogeoica yunlongensis)]